MKLRITYRFNRECILGTILLIIGLILLSGIFIDSFLINPSLQIKQYIYFNRYIPVFAIGLLFVVLVSKKKFPLSKLFYSSEILVFLFALIMVAVYQWQLNPAPERLFFLLQICCLWYLLRVANYYYPILSVLWQVALMIFGGIQSVIGMMQLYGWEYSNHSLFSMTGSFFNPGPYSGFLALTLPISVYFILRYKHYKRISILYKSVYWSAWICAVLILMALPATMGRTAWIAAITSSLWVVWRERNSMLKNIWRKHKVKLIVSGASIFVVLVFLLGSSYYMKEASANGRIFLWKIDVLTWVNNWTGTGMGGFPAAYGNAQADYFAHSDFSEKEELVAGAPAYAFNEYLQLLIEHSLWGMIIVLWMGYKAFYCGYWNRQSGWIGVLIALSIFAFASYPLQLPAFVIILVFAATGCMSWKRNEDFYAENYSHKNKLKTIRLIVSLTTIVCIIAYRQWNIEDPYREWENTKMLYQIKAYEKAADSYGKLYPVLGSQPDFLFEYGHALAKLEKYDFSNDVLNKGTKVSSDPMFWNVMGKNYQAKGNLGEAEQCYKRAINMLPGRIYPYYLLTKLYAEPDIYRKERMLRIGKIVLEKEPKVQSTAVRQMRNEIKQLMNHK